MDSKEPQNALLLLVVPKQSFPREPILLYSTGLMNNSKEDSPPSTGFLGRPLSAESDSCSQDQNVVQTVWNEQFTEVL